MKLSEHEKHVLYFTGHYACDVPPVPTDHWTPGSWLKWIDHHGVWDSPVQPNDSVVRSSSGE